MSELCSYPNPALRFAQYAFFVSESFKRYSGVSNSARLALYSGEFMVSLSRSLRCAKASGSFIFSSLLGWAALMPAIRLALNSSSLPLRSDQLFIFGLLLSRFANEARVSIDKFFCTPVRSAIRAARNSWSCHMALSFSRTSGFLAGLASPVNSTLTAGSCILSRCLALACGLLAGWFGSSIAWRSFSLCSCVGECIPSPPTRKLVNEPVPVWTRPYCSINLRSSSCPSIIEPTI